MGSRSNADPQPASRQQWALSSSCDLHGLSGVQEHLCGVQHLSSCFWFATGKTKSKTKPLHRGRCSPTASSQRRSDGWPLKDANVREAADLPHQTSSQRQRRDASKSASGCSGRPCHCQLQQLHIHHLHLQIQQQHRRPSIHPPPARNLHTPHETSGRGKLRPGGHMRPTGLFECSPPIFPTYLPYLSVSALYDITEGWSLQLLLVDGTKVGIFSFH